MKPTERTTDDLEKELAETGLDAKVIAILKFEPDPGANELILKNLKEKGRFVAIEDQNFPWLLTTCRQFANLAISGAFPGWAPGAVADLIFTVMDFRAKSIDLSAEEGAVLLELKKSGGMQADELESALGLDGSTVSTALQSLAGEKKRRDDVPVKLVECDDKGVWKSPNV